VALDARAREGANPRPEGRRAGAARGGRGATAWPRVERRTGGRRASDRRGTTQFAPPVVVVRWATLAIGIALAAPDIADERGVVMAWGAVLAAYTIWRTAHPISNVDSRRGAGAVLAEVLLNVAAVTTTGMWDSPWVFALIAAVMVAGFERSFVFAMRIGVLTTLAVGIPALVAGDDVAAELRQGAQWGGELLLVALVAGYARRLSTESQEQHTLALDRLGRLAEANSLLYSLHRVAQTLPASLDLDEVLDSSMSRLRDLVAFDSAVLFLLEETDGTWVPVRREALKVPGPLRTDELPEPLQVAAASTTASAEGDLLRAGRTGVAPSAAAGIYAPLRARGALIGLLAIESTSDRRFVPRDVELVNGFVEPLALAVDNARWFARLRTIGADEERTRIARDVHDRIGQSLAYLAFELDRIVRTNERGEEVGPALDALRKDLREVIREVRDTLYDLRTDVSEGHSVTTTMEAFLERVKARSGLEVSFRWSETGRLPLPQERELWRIAKEAVTNVERHAHATRLSISWQCDGQSAELVVADDGIGFSGTASRIDSYGILGMRERAASVGARLEIESKPGSGTVVRTTLDARER